MIVRQLGLYFGLLWTHLKGIGSYVLSGLGEGCSVYGSTKFSCCLVCTNHSTSTHLGSLAFYIWPVFHIGAVLHVTISVSHCSLTFHCSSICVKFRMCKPTIAENITFSQPTANSLTKNTECVKPIKHVKCIQMTSWY